MWMQMRWWLCFDSRGFLFAFLVATGEYWFQGFYDFLFWEAKNWTQALHGIIKKRNKPQIGIKKAPQYSPVWLKPGSVATFFIYSEANNLITR